MESSKRTQELGEVYLNLMKKKCDCSAGDSSNRKKTDTFFRMCELMTILFMTCALIYSYKSIWDLRRDVEILKEKYILEKKIELEIRPPGRLSRNMLDPEESDVSGMLQLGSYTTEKDYESEENGLRKRKREIEASSENINKSEQSMDGYISSASEERSSEISLNNFHTSFETVNPAARKSKRNHKKSKKYHRQLISAEKFYTEIDSTTTSPIHVRRSRTKQTDSSEKYRKALEHKRVLHYFICWYEIMVPIYGPFLSNRFPSYLSEGIVDGKSTMFTVYTSLIEWAQITIYHGRFKAILLQPLLQVYASKESITKEEALRRKLTNELGLSQVKYLNESNETVSTSKEVTESIQYNMVMVHFAADTSHYSRERDSHYFGNGRMRMKASVYKDWKPAHWTQGVNITKYFSLGQGRVTVYVTGIYLIYAQVQYSNVQEVNGYSVMCDKQAVVQCITTSVHPDKEEIKSNTCGTSTTILLNANDRIYLQDLHHGRHVVLTPEKSYFGLILLSPLKSNKISPSP